MADLCPAATWTAIPALDRETTPALLFAPGCLPGTADAAGTCAARDLRYTIAIPWSTFLAQARKAPGGNLYWDASVPADRRNPTAFWLMNQMAIRNMVTWRARGSRGGERVADAIGMGFLTKIGLVSAPVDPLPNETTDAFNRRGGQLFYPSTGGYYAFGGGVPIYSLVPRQLVNQGDAVKQLMFGAVPDWMTNVRDVEIYASYNVAAARIDYTIRLAWTNAGAQAVDATVGWLEQNVSRLCTKLNEPNVVVATSAAGATPVTAPYAAGATTVRTLCNLPGTYAAMTGCLPRTPGSPGSVEALLTTPVILSAKYMRFASLTGGGKAAMSAQTPGTATAVTVGPTAAPAPVPSGYPPGTIAWRDPATPGYDVAVPAPGPGVTHRVVAMGVAPPADVPVVGRAAWERATLPWIRRRTAKIGLTAAGVVAAVVGTMAAVRH